MSSPSNELRILVSSALGLIATAGVFAAFTTPYMAAASASYLAMAIGIAFRSEKRIHIPLMALAVTTDVSLVLLLEVGRSAIATAISGSLNALQLGHILCSSAAVALYVPTVALGIAAAVKKPGARRSRVHGAVGVAAFVLRSAGFVLMFSLLDKTKS
jgi:hypothetical protein